MNPPKPVRCKVYRLHRWGHWAVTCTWCGPSTTFARDWHEAMQYAQDHLRIGHR